MAITHSLHTVTLSAAMAASIFWATGPDTHGVQISSDFLSNSNPAIFSLTPVRPEALVAKSEAERSGVLMQEHPVDKESILVKANRVFAQRSTDQGATWSRQERPVPGMDVLAGFNRSAQLEDGSILVSLYGNDSDGHPRGFVWYSPDGGQRWRLIPMGPHASEVRTDETAYVEVSPGRVLAQSRNETGYFSEIWSDDSGRTWSHPVLTDIWAPHSPPHLLALRDGRILCSYGYRRSPMGIRAVLSEDGGRTWDTDNTIVLREDGGTPSGTRPKPEDVDVENLRLSGSVFRTELAKAVSATKYPVEHARPDLGYANSVQLSDGSILTVYYITLADAVTHAVGTRWSV